MIEQVLDPEACVERMAGPLTPGGVLYVEVPNDFNVFEETARARLDKPTWWVALSHPLNHFDYQSLGGLLARYGLEEIDRLASFAIAMFLSMGEDQVGNPLVAIRDTRRIEGVVAQGGWFQARPIEVRRA